MALCDKLKAAQAEREACRSRLTAASLARLNQPAEEPAFQEHVQFHLRHFPRFTTRPEQIRDLRQTILNLAVRGKLVTQDAADGGIGNKIEIVIEGNGIPIGVAVDAVNVAETALGLTALTMVLVTLPLRLESPIPVLADRACDFDWLREHPKKRGLYIVAKHRSNRVKNSTSDGRWERRLKRRWKIERSNAWLHSYRRALIPLLLL
ncbi:hypothetical protein BH11PLA2_BH11PLA2_48450 [soil metagenome]